MTFLELVQRVAAECGVPVSSLTTTVGQTGEALRLVQWVNTAWLEIQGKREDWEWMRTTASWTTTQAQATYTTAQCGITAGTFGAWKPNTFRCYTTASGLSDEQYMVSVDYDYWRDKYQFGTNQTNYQRPDEIAVTPSKGVALGPYPTSGFTIRGDYYLAPSELSGDSDTPEIRSYFHMAIVYGAMKSYAAFESAPEVYSRADTQYRKLMKELSRDQAPALLVAEPLA